MSQEHRQFQVNRHNVDLAVLADALRAMGYSVIAQPDGLAFSMVEGLPIHQAQLVDDGSVVFRQHGTAGKRDAAWEQGIWRRYIYQLAFRAAKDAGWRLRTMYPSAGSSGIIVLALSDATLDVYVQDREWSRERFYAALAPHVIDVTTFETLSASPAERTAP